MRKTALRLLTVLYAATPLALPAAEGMWTLDNLPVDAIRSAHGFAPDRAWTDRAMRASLRLAGGCSASFVSANGLVLTNHHCIRDCVAELSTASRDLVADGFVARKPAEELRCPTAELNRLTKITDVTDQVMAATKGLTGEAYQQALTAERARLTGDCTGKAGARVRCDLVTLYGGGRYHLYRYDRFQDVRLVFVPEESAAAFGGDPDNFSFPRYTLDVGLLRAWQDGRPVQVKDYFLLNPAGPVGSEVLFTLGHPGSTDRQLTQAQVIGQRDTDIIPALLQGSELRGQLAAFGRESPERLRISQGPRFGVENSLKARKGILAALLDPALLAAKAEQDAALQAFVNADPALKATTAGAWDALAEAQRVYGDIAPAWKLLERGRAFLSIHFDHARLLVRGAAERTRPDGERLREFASAAMPAVEQRLFAEVPIYPELEELTLAWSLTQFREILSVDDPRVQRVLGTESPEDMARRLVSGTTLGDVATRKALWEGGTAAINASTDPFIRLALAVDADSRELRQRFEAEVESVDDRQGGLLAQARFARDGTRVYPDATFSLRLSYGVVKGWEERGVQITPYTDFGGLFRRATGAPPFSLPPSWLRRQPTLDMSQRLNFVTTHDITGGNSGSPVINRAGDVVGLIFDGNLLSLGGDYLYDESVNRAVSVHSGAIVAALREVYAAEGLADELLGGRGARR